MQTPTNIEWGADFASTQGPLIRMNLHRRSWWELRGRRCLGVRFSRGHIILCLQLSRDSQCREDKDNPEIIANCHDMYDGARSSGLRLKQIGRGTVKTHSANQPFSRLKHRERDSCPKGRLNFEIRLVGKKWIFAGITQQAGEGNRTLVSSLEGYSFTIKLHPHLAVQIAAPIPSCQMLFLETCQPLPALLALSYV